MRELLDQVLRAADARLYYLALFGALAVPDVCASMESADGLTNASRYISWFDSHVAPAYTVGPDRQPSLTGEDAYGVRCSMLHQSRTRPHRGAYSRVVFVEPGHHGLVMHNNVMGDALNLDISLFCRDVVTAASDWLVNAERTRTYQANYPHFLQRYPEGIAPYIVGVPVLS